MKQFASNWTEGLFDKKISKVIETQDETKRHMNIGKSKVFDTNLIYTRVIGLQISSCETDIDRILARVCTSSNINFK